jgi:hypothetical protein
MICRERTGTGGREWGGREEVGGRECQLRHLQRHLRRHQNLPPLPGAARRTLSEFEGVDEVVGVDGVDGAVAFHPLEQSRVHSSAKRRSNLEQRCWCK